MISFVHLSIILCMLPRLSVSTNFVLHSVFPHAAGWVSGAFFIPPACAGMSARACESCGAGANMTGCLACVNSTQQDAASLAIRGIPNLRMPQVCLQMQ
jgi:hypothetical protein